jgi:hypothetical protein
MTLEDVSLLFGLPGSREPMGAAARDDGGFPRLDTTCRRGVGGGNVGGGRGAGSGAPLATPSPESAVAGCGHPCDPFTYPTHHTRAAQRAAEAVRRREHHAPPRSTKHDRI